jgi:hypothetical protein
VKGTPDLQTDPHVERALGGEDMLAAVQLDDVLVALTASRLLVADRQRIRLDMPLDELHRVQLVVESDRPGLLTLVPTTDRYPAELVSVPLQRLEDVGQVVMAIGRKVAGRP